MTYRTSKINGLAAFSSVGDYITFEVEEKPQRDVPKLSLETLKCLKAIDGNKNFSFEGAKKYFLNEE